MLLECSHCGQRYLPIHEWKHRCKPPYLVFCEELGETELDAVSIRTSDAEDAAKEFVERYDAEDLRIATQESRLRVHVRDNGVWQVYVVTGSIKAHYYAEREAT